MPHWQHAYQRVLARQILRLLDLQHVRYEIAEADDEQGGPQDKRNSTDATVRHLPVRKHDTFGSAGCAGAERKATNF